jgi:hypothetical protein
MADISWQEQATNTVGVLQRIVVATTAGAVVVLVIVLSIGPFALRSRRLLPRALIGTVVVGVVIISWPFHLRKITANARREIVKGTYLPFDPTEGMKLLSPSGANKPPGPYSDEKYLLAFFRNRTIISTAMVGMCQFGATIAYLAEGYRLSLGLAAVLILGVAVHFPTRSRTIGWIERQMKKVKQEKMLV